MHPAPTYRAPPPAAPRTPHPVPPRPHEHPLARELLDALIPGVRHIHVPTLRVVRDPSALAPTAPRLVLEVELARPTARAAEPAEHLAGRPQFHHPVGQRIDHIDVPLGSDRTRP